MRLAKDWDCMISGTEYGTYRGPAHYVVRACMMVLTGLHPPWSSCKNQAMQLQLLALPSNSTEGSITFWVPFFSLVTKRWTLTVFFCFHLAITYCKSKICYHYSFSQLTTLMNAWCQSFDRFWKDCSVSAVTSVSQPTGASSAMACWSAKCSHGNMLQSKRHSFGVAVQCPQMEFVCFIWANSRSRNSHAFLPRCL
jgi:hypothetical protein